MWVTTIICPRDRVQEEGLRFPSHRIYDRLDALADQARQWAPSVAWLAHGVPGASLGDSRAYRWTRTPLALDSRALWPAVRAGALRGATSHNGDESGRNPRDHRRRARCAHEGGWADHRCVYPWAAYDIPRRWPGTIDCRRARDFSGDRLSRSSAVDRCARGFSTRRRYLGRTHQQPRPDPNHRRLGSEPRVPRQRHCSHLP